MKFLVLLVILLICWHWIRQQRATSSSHTFRDASNARHGQAPTPPSAQWMIECPICGTHLPESDAVRGQRNLYCSVAHRQQAEG